MDPWRTIWNDWRTAWPEDNTGEQVSEEIMEPIRASEINDIIRKQIENFDTGVTVTEVGTVIKIGDGIAEIHGLEKVMAGELVAIPPALRGRALHPRKR